MFNFVSVSGYGWSGSSACIDLLREFDGFGAIPGEFRIAKDPYGLLDLENSLVHNWDFIRHDVAIRDFLNLCHMLSRETGLYSRAGKGFSSKLDVDFIGESELYIDRLLEMMYMGNTSVHRYNIPSYKNFFMKIKNKTGKSNAVPMYLARPSKSDFILETRSYIKRLFNNYAKSRELKTIVLDQAVPTGNIANTTNYFESIKVIIIARDPRDIYSSLVRNNTLIGADFNNNDSAEKYIAWHNVLRKKSQEKDSKAVLRLNFEDLVCKYDQSVEKIVNFLDGSLNHKNKYKYFDPNSERSRSNVGLWKKHTDQLVMGKIAEELKDYCYSK